MTDEQKLMSDAKYKQFIAAVDKSLKSFEYSSEWADLISCLGKLNKVIVTYKQYSAVPRKLLIGKRLAQCLHPALPSGVHLKALESYDLILKQIGSARLAQDLFIYTSGLFPLLSQASTAVKPVLLDIYEKHFLPLKRKLFPGLSGLLLALLPGIEEVSEYTERTSALLSQVCEATEEAIFFACLWDNVLHSPQIRLAAMTFVIGHLAKKHGDFKEGIMGSDINLMVNAVCASFDDSNVLVQRITLDFAISFISFHNTNLSQNLLVKLLTYALGVLLRRDMSLNRRIFQWLLNVNGEGNPISNINGSISVEDQTDDENMQDSYFDVYSKEVVTAALVLLFQDVVENVQDGPKTKSNTIKYKSVHLKPFRILITLLDKPEVGSVVLEEVMLEVFRTLYGHFQLKNKLVEANSRKSKDITAVHDEIVKNANLLFNSFEPFFMWDYFGRLLQKCYKEGEEDVSISLVKIRQPNYYELFQLISYLLDVVSLEISTETQSEHWPNLLKQIINEAIENVSSMDVDTLVEGISLISKLLSRLSPNLIGHQHEQQSDLSNSVFLSHKTPPMSPLYHDFEIFSFDDSAGPASPGVINECVELSKILFSKFVERRVFKRNQKMLMMFQESKQLEAIFDAVYLQVPSTMQYEAYDDITNNEKNDLIIKGFQIFCRYLVQLSCFPVPANNRPSNENKDFVADWLQVLITCCCYGNCFDTQATAIGTLLDLVDVTLIARCEQEKSTESASHIVPLISFSDLRWIEKSNLYKVLAKSLWQRLSPRTCQWHQGAVNLFLHLHNVTPTSNTCEDVISNSLVDLNLHVKELSHWRFLIMWHLSREFYKEDKNKSTVATRTIDKCMLLMIDSLPNENSKIREYAEQWLQHSVHFGDIGRIIESIFIILLDPTSARVAIHYAKEWSINNAVSCVTTKPTENESGLNKEKNATESVPSSPAEPVRALSRISGFADDEDDDVDDQIREKEKVGKHKNSRVKTLPTHPLLIHKLLYTQHYDTQQCLYTLRRIILILKSEGRSFICAAATTSMNMCNTPHQAILRQLLIRHRRVLSGNDFYGSLAEAHQLMIRASTAKYLEILLSVCLYFIRSEYHERLDVSASEYEGNFAVRNTSAEALTLVCHLLLEIASDSGKGFSSYINDLLSRSKIQRISLHCLLSTVYAVTGDYRESSETGYYSMVECSNLTETTPRNSSTRSQLDLQRGLLRLIEGLIHLEHCIGTENVVTAHTNEKKNKRDKNGSNSSTVYPFEYVQYKPILSQPMFISATLTVLREKQWMHLHDNWIKLLISCLPKFSDDMSKVIVPVVAQACVNLKNVTRIFKESYTSRESNCHFEMPPDYMLVLLTGLTSFCHYCLIGTSTSASMASNSRPGGGMKMVVDDTSSSLLSNIVHAFSASPTPSSKPGTQEEGAKSFAETRDGLLGILPSILTAVTSVWKVWDADKMALHGLPFVSKIPLAIGQPKAVLLSILQLITPIAMNHTVVFLASVADVWCSYRDTTFTKPSLTLRGKEWLSVMNKKFLHDMTDDQKNLLEIVQAIKALSVELIVETSRQVLRQLMTMKERAQNFPLEVCLLQFLYELLQKATKEEIIQVKTSFVNLLKEGLQLNMSPPSLFVLFALLNIYVQRVPLPEERRARRDLQDLAQKFMESLNNVAAASLEGSAWFRRSLQVVTQLDHSSDFEESSHSDKSSVPDSFHPSPGGLKNSQYSVPAILIMAEYLPAMLDMLYLSEEKDKIASSLIYLMYNIIPYLKNHSTQNMTGYRACSALLAAISDYQYTLRAWRKDVYELFLDNDFFQMDTHSFTFWKTTVDRLITYDNTVFKDLMTKISLSQSGAINIFANREQEMEQRAQLLKRLTFAIFCGEFDQYHQYLPDIQERLAESIRQLQGPFLHEQVFLCFRVLLTRMSPNHLVSLWPPVLTELVLVFVHMEHELSTTGKPKSKSKVALLESFLGINGYFKDPNKWLRLYLAVCKLLDFLLVLPGDVLQYYQVYKWAFSETPGVYCATDLPTEQELIVTKSSAENKQEIMNGHKNRIRHDSHNKTKDDEVSKMAVLNAPISQQKKLTQKEKPTKHKDLPKQETVMSVFLPYISRIIKLLRKQNLAEDSWQAPLRVSGQLIVTQTKIVSIYDLMPFFLAVTGELAAHDVDVSKLNRFKIQDVEDLIENDFIENTTSQS